MKKQYIYALISILMWSTTATTVKLLLGDLDSMQILFFGSLFAFIFLSIVNMFRGSLKEVKTYKAIDYVQIAIIGLFGTFFYKLFLYLGIDKLQASQAFVINYLWPIMTVIFACIILKEKMTFRKMVAIILSFIGVIIVTSNGNLFNIGKSTAVGAILCILAAISYGLHSVLNKKKSYDKFVSMMLFYFFTIIVSLVYILITKTWFVPNLPQTMGLLWNGVFTSAIAYTTWALALRDGDTAKISNLAYITPFLSLVWTRLILKEKWSAYTIIGLIVIVLGIFIQLRKKENEEK